jgi:hypothetical protein
VAHLVRFPFVLDEALVIVEGEWRECRVTGAVLVLYTPRQRSRYLDVPDTPEQVELDSVAKIESVEWEHGKLTESDAGLHYLSESARLLRESVEAILFADERWLVRIVDENRDRLAVLKCG